MFGWWTRPRILRRIATAYGSTTGMPSQTSRGGLTRCINAQRSNPTTPNGDRSLQAAFEPDQNRNLKRIGEDVLHFVKRHHCYHFLIDRFGQVFRVVQESDAANHAGNSVWADDRVIYVNLNASFLGIA